VIIMSKTPNMYDNREQYLTGHRLGFDAGHADHKINMVDQHRMNSNIAGLYGVTGSLILGYVDGYRTWER
jgi:hypothetical protein